MSIAYSFTTMQPSVEQTCLFMPPRIGRRAVFLKTSKLEHCVWALVVDDTMLIQKQFSYCRFEPTHQNPHMIFGVAALSRSYGNKPFEIEIRNAKNNTA